MNAPTIAIFCKRCHPEKYTCEIGSSIIYYSKVMANVTSFGGQMDKGINKSNGHTGEKLYAPDLLTLGHKKEKQNLFVKKEKNTPVIYNFRTHKEILSFQFNLFPNKLRILCVCSTSLLKTLWKKEKLLIMSNFSFSHSVF